MKENKHQTAQILAAVVADNNDRRWQQLQGNLELQDIAFKKAIEQIDRVRDFVGSPEHILGNPRTKHGEIAEQVEVGIRNASDYLNQHAPRATFAGVGRTAPEDYLINNIPVQSKFMNGVSQNLDGILEHLQKYDYFGRDRSYYKIPKDYYETIQKVLAGESVENLSSRTIDRILTKVKEIETLSGQSFTRVVQPSLSNYSDVQTGQVHETLDRHEQHLQNRNQNINENLYQNARPNLANMAGVALQGAAIGAGLRLSLKLYSKFQQGKNLFLGDLTPEDWQELGLDVAEGALTGGISASSIYYLTNFANLSAPFAGAIVSAGFSVASLVKSYQSGDISWEELQELGQITCAESAIVALAAALGQTVIPIPILGAAVGTIAARIFMSYGKLYLSPEADRWQQMQSYYQKCLEKIDATYREVLDRILAEYERLGNLTEAALNLDINVNLRLQASIELAEAYGVPEENIIRNISDLDTFMWQ